MLQCVHLLRLRFDSPLLSADRFLLSCDRAGHPYENTTAADEGHSAVHPISDRHPVRHGHFPFGPRGSMVSGRHVGSMKSTRLPVRLAALFSARKSAASASHSFFDT